MTTLPIGIIALIIGLGLFCLVLLAIVIFFLNLFWAILSALWRR